MIEVETIFNMIFGWKYIWWAMLGLYVFLSETLYFMMCKYDLGEFEDGKEWNWIKKKIFSLFIVIPITFGLTLIIPGIITLVMNIVINPLTSLKISGIIVGIILAIFIFFYTNYKIWERFN